MQMECNRNSPIVLDALWITPTIIAKLCCSVSRRKQGCPYGREVISVKSLVAALTDIDFPESYLDLGFL